MAGEANVNLVVGVSDAKASNQPGDVLTTHALGSCIGVALFDAPANVGGLLHFQLPSSTADTQRAKEKPLMFADTGMKALLGEMSRLGADKRRIRVRLAGGANMLNDQNMFDIGRRNHAAIRKLLWQQGMFIDGEHVGGTLPRTVQLNVGNGSFVIKCYNQLIAL
jgi:chemotaxis protein CheD